MKEINDFSQGPEKKTPSRPSITSMLQTDRYLQILRSLPEVRENVVKQFQGVVNKLDWPTHETKHLLAILLAQTLTRN